jgi:hypothetical protein
MVVPFSRAVEPISVSFVSLSLITALNVFCAPKKRGRNSKSVNSFFIIANVMIQIGSSNLQ